MYPLGVFTRLVNNERHSETHFRGIVLFNIFFFFFPELDKKIAFSGPTFLVSFKFLLRKKKKNIYIESANVGSRWFSTLSMILSRVLGFVRGGRHLGSTLLTK